MNYFSNTTPVDWSEEDKKLIEWFLSLPEASYPKTPFLLRPGVRVVDFFSVLKEEIAMGPGSPRTLYGALQNDIKDLKKVIDGSLRADALHDSNKIGESNGTREPDTGNNGGAPSADAPRD